MTALTTDRMTMKTVSMSDYDDLCALWADPVFATAIFPAPLNSEEVWFRLLRDLGHWQALGHGNWSIRDTTSGDYVGSIGVLDYRRLTSPVLDAPELAWGIAPRFQRQGLAFEAVVAVLNWCDQTLKTSRTVCLIAPDNAPSHALAQRVGYRPYAQCEYKGSPVVLLERSAVASH